MGDEDDVTGVVMAISVVGRVRWALCGMVVGAAGAQTYLGARTLRCVRSQED